MAKSPFNRRPEAPAPPAAPAAPAAAAGAVPPAAPADPDILVIDIAGVSTKFEAMPVGIYSAVVDEVEHIVASKKSGKPYIKFTFMITTPEFDGRKVFHNCSLEKAALWKLLKALEALGMDIEGDTLQLDKEAMIGLPCNLSLAIEDYQGNAKNNVQDVLPPKNIGASAAPVF